MNNFETVKEFAFLTKIKFKNFSPLLYSCHRSLPFQSFSKKFTFIKSRQKNLNLFTVSKSFISACGFDRLFSTKSTAFFNDAHCYILNIFLLHQQLTESHIIFEQQKIKF